MNRNISIGVGILLCLIAIGCNLKPGDKVIARVNNEAITESEFQARINRLPAYYRALAVEQKERFLDEIINEKLFLKEAYRLHVDRNKEVKDLVDEARKKIITAKYIEDQIKKNTKISSKDIEQYYELHKKEFVTLERYRASHILVLTQDEAKKVLVRLNNGEDFSAVAKEVSIDPSKTNGGDLGYFTEGQMIPDFEAACFKLEPGQTSDIVKTQFGYHVIRLTEKIPAHERPLNEASEQIKSRLMDAKKIQNLQEIIKDLRSRAKITVYKESSNDKDSQ
ncbi:MAG: peptidylprolyl isomerase [Candidatus Omnitrophica bacterium CG12_big_fil_rev_8_21_14_0_65_43_15]|uniref:Peptidylprolyl isomerase n=1 Tax=Candidatus Taenaricola geysiri TaxID=1974752 RepID=A0A2J0LE93_9BACT|nr:MAG: hypothetical protein AUJ89_04630 [Candidatus Omnitrophica bacterium CG1_02_43_210]PIR65717.1 MAG: peptidylprolyl isomerase [Candidatus Omnitrophica bacterium CG10_big_fil_rev_8_21_14_0_10_43_8]PIV12506.1 MAG: peptidylprolyl isomerase [Candidatus Omnitrophica bacterium CG03_land_8_20_14_0_80_43_22]PIW66165.1 MAG: peptidylprolyl isomerase [Candidatus Omnitrophica bacterium CG12_big_fil_rev_8_21_14_0_65_43_15]PIW80224.1 MAG: peptidylprolyl isomerase [Candidatus Omnitrophica bacterium CG_4_